MDGAGKRQFLYNKWRMLIGKIRRRDLMHGSRFEMRQRRIEATNLAAARRYRPQPYAGATRVLITADRVLDLREDPRQKWVDVLASGASIKRIPGKDTGDALERHPAQVAAQMRQWIDDCVD